MHSRYKRRAADLETINPDDSEIRQVSVSLDIDTPACNCDSGLCNNNAYQAHKDQSSSSEIFDNVCTKESKHKVSGSQTQCDAQDIELLGNADCLQCWVHVETNDAAA